MSTTKTMFALTCTVLCMSFCAKDDGSPTSPTPDTVNELGTWVGDITGIYVQQLGDTVDHHFYLRLSSDGTYSLDDTLETRTQGIKIGTPVEIGTWVKSASVYTLSPTECADKQTGRLDSSHCTAGLRTATESGTTITIEGFYQGVLDLVMSKL